MLSIVFSLTREALQLRVTDVDLGNRSLTFPGQILKGKGHALRQEEIPAMLAQLFDWYDWPAQGYL